MKDVQFTVYDIFGYLAPGFIVLLLLDYVFGLQWILERKLTLTDSLFWILVAYILGHLASSGAKALYEKTLVECALDKPLDVLLGNHKSGTRLKKVLVRIFGAYYDSLDAHTVKIAREKCLAAVGESVTEETKFDAALHHMRTSAKTDDNSWALLGNYLVLYGFCRNVSFSLLLTFSVSLIVAWVAILSPSGMQGLEIITISDLSLLLAVGLLFRYLKFYRLYHEELLTEFACKPNNDEEQPGTFSRIRVSRRWLHYG